MLFPRAMRRRQVIAQIPNLAVTRIHAITQAHAIFRPLQFISESQARQIITRLRLMYDNNTVSTPEYAVQQEALISLFFPHSRDRLIPYHIIHELAQRGHYVPDDAARTSNEALIAAIIEMALFGINNQKLPVTNRSLIGAILQHMSTATRLRGQTQATQEIYTRWLEEYHRRLLQHYHFWPERKDNPKLPKFLAEQRQYVSELRQNLQRALIAN